VLEPGDLLVIYTDGAIEVTSPAEEEFGESRLQEICLAERTNPLAEMSRRIEESLYEFSQGAPLPDDLTLVAIRRDG
jgi:sigma-B regulation protein RsbU (phosphoserine phosphatase)